MHDILEIQICLPPPLTDLHYNVPHTYQSAFESGSPPPRNRWKVQQLSEKPLSVVHATGRHETSVQRLSDPYPEKRCWHRELWDERPGLRVSLKAKLCLEHILRSLGKLINLQQTFSYQYQRLVLLGSFQLRAHTAVVAPGFCCKYTAC